MLPVLPDEAPWVLALPRCVEFVWRVIVICSGLKSNSTDAGGSLQINIALATVPSYRNPSCASSRTSVAMSEVFAFISGPVHDIGNTLRNDHVCTGLTMASSRVICAVPPVKVPSLDDSHCMTLGASIEFIARTSVIVEYSTCPGR